MVSLSVASALAQVPPAEPASPPPGEAPAPPAPPPPPVEAPAPEAAASAPGQTPQEPQAAVEAKPTGLASGKALIGADLRPQTIESAQAGAGTPSPAFLVKLSVWLDRAHQSPGEIDARLGANLREALATFEGAHHLPGDGSITPEALNALAAIAGKAPVVQRYTITDKDEAGPFIGRLPSDFYTQSKIKRMGYLSPEQELAERFHMSPALLEAMNPGADFSKAGTPLNVLAVHTGGLGASIVRIEVDKTSKQVRALGAQDQLIASFPATIGSTERPAPSGRWAVAAVRFDPVYVYDPRVLTWGPRQHGRFTIKPGPNNPTGVVWIGLTKPTYGIHGTPNAGLVGKTASHGCVRLTNWDAWDLGNAVKAGVPVVFVGADKA